MIYHAFGWKLPFLIASDPIKGFDFKNAELLIDKTIDDHLEQLWFKDGKFYRYAGGGRGFYWTQELHPTFIHPESTDAIKLLRMFATAKELVDRFTEVR